MIDEKSFKLIYGQKDFMLEHDTLECLEKYMMTEDLATRLLSSYKKVEDPIIQESIVPKPIIQELVLKESPIKEPIVKELVLKEPIKKEPIVQGPPPIQKPQYKYHAKSKDSVFTCVFVAINGEQSLFQKGTTATNLLMNEKRLISEHLNKNPNALKASNYKLTIAKMNEIRCDLMTRPFMDKAAGGLVACAIYYKRPIYAVFEERRQCR